MFVSLFTLGFVVTSGVIGLTVAALTGRNDQ